MLLLLLVYLVFGPHKEEKESSPLLAFRDGENRGWYNRFYLVGNRDFLKLAMSCVLSP